MLRTKLVYFAGRMQRIPKENQAVHIGDAGGSNLRSYSSAHRFATNDQCAVADLFVPNRLDQGSETRFEGLIRVRNAPALLCVQKIERDGVNPARCEPSCKSRHEITALIGASSVAQNHRDTGEVRFARRVDEGLSLIHISEPTRLGM